MKAKHPKFLRLINDQLNAACIIYDWYGYIAIQPMGQEINKLAYTTETHKKVDFGKWNSKIYCVDLNRIFFLIFYG